MPGFSLGSEVEPMDSLHNSPCSTHSRTRRLLIAALVTALVLTTVTTAGGTRPNPAQAQSGAVWFEPSKPYNDYFADPSVFWDRTSSRYWAFATLTGGAYLPAQWSTDLRTWTARDAYKDPGSIQPADETYRDPFFNHALVDEPSWAAPRDVGHWHLQASIWAPGVARIGGRYLAYHAVRCGTSPGSAGPRACWSSTSPASERFCIGVTGSVRAGGPYYDQRSTPLTCSPDPKGALDPDPFIDRAGRPWLMYKSEGVPGAKPTRLWARRLDRSGAKFASGSRLRMVLETRSNSWEGNVIENPSMVYWPRHKVYVLFYSGNEWRSSNYATGYAICSTPTRCQRTQSSPLLSSTTPAIAARGLVAPGGADGFIDQRGRLQVAFHAYDAATGAGADQPRKLHTMRLALSKDKRRLVPA